MNADRTDLQNPVRGWYGSDDPMGFGFDAGPAAGASRFLTGTPPILSTVLVEPGVDLILEAGIDRLRAKSVALTERFIALVDLHLAPLGFEVRSPRAPAQRGSHVSLRHDAAQAVSQALVNEARVISDSRPPDLIRFGFAPLYIGFADVDEAIRRIVEVVESGGIDRWRDLQPVVP